MSKALIRFARSQGLAWVVVVTSSLLFFSCSATSPHSEALTEHYWDVQALLMQAGDATLREQALRDLAGVYLRTGHYEKAEEVLALVEGSTDPQVWFYRGLAYELLDREAEAAQAYGKAPLLSDQSIYSQAVQGRLAWLAQEKWLQDLEQSLEQPPPVAPDTALFAVIPFECKSDGGAYANLGKGFSEILSHNLGQIRELDAIASVRVKQALNWRLDRVEAMDIDAVDWIRRAFGAGTIVEGNCRVAADSITIDLALTHADDDVRLAVSVTTPVEETVALEKQIMDRLVDGLGIWIPNRVRALPREAAALEALQLFGEGIAREYEGELAASAALYEDVATRYPLFELANAKYHLMEHQLMTRSTSKKDLVDLVSGLTLFASDQLLEQRVRQVRAHLGAGYVPGQDTRKLPPGKLGELPGPPAPSGNQ